MKYSITFTLLVFVLNNLIAQSFTLKDMRHFSWLGKCDYDKMVKKGFTLTAENLTILYLHYEFENKKTQEQVVIDSDCRFLYDGITAWKTAYYTNSKPEYDKFSVFVKKYPISHFSDEDLYENATSSYTSVA